MDKVLEKNLERDHHFYWLIETAFGLHLGVADKFLLLSYLKTKNHKCYDDLWRNIRDFLWEMDYSSKEITESHRQDERINNYWAQILNESGPISFS
ncbi:MAG: hypothetical protein M1165_00600 [Candidatus Pacearchaeota archaeon]|nr:hypothetical protein [Candidatus Pacearchaeota archaeon]